VRFAGLRRLGLWWVISVFVVVGVGLIVFAARLRLGGFVIGLGLLIAAVLRLVVKEPRGGGIDPVASPRRRHTPRRRGPGVRGVLSRAHLRAGPPGRARSVAARAASCPRRLDPHTPFIFQG
jgi:hypothetical protein